LNRQRLMLSKNRRGNSIKNVRRKFKVTLKILVIN
jgi:hypothetical protein